MFSSVTTDEQQCSPPSPSADKPRPASPPPARSPRRKQPRPAKRTTSVSAPNEGVLLLQHKANTVVGRFNVDLIESDRVMMDKGGLKLADLDGTWHSWNIRNAAQATFVNEIRLTDDAHKANAIMYYVNEEGHHGGTDASTSTKVAEDMHGLASGSRGVLNMVVTEDTAAANLRCWDTVYGVVGEGDTKRRTGEGDTQRRVGGRGNTTNKTHECPRCRLARFDSIDNLRVHMTQYCEKRMAIEAAEHMRRMASKTATPSANETMIASLDAASVWRSALMSLVEHQTANENSARQSTLNALLAVIAQQQTRAQVPRLQPVAPPPPPPPAPATQTVEESPQPIFLPMAFTPNNVNTVQIIGPAQCVIPVAVPRTEGEWRAALPPIAFTIHDQANMTLPLARDVQLTLNDHVKVALHSHTQDRRKSHSIVAPPPTAEVAIDLSVVSPLTQHNRTLEVPQGDGPSAAAVVKSVHRVSPFVANGRLSTPMQAMSRSPFLLVGGVKPFACECGVSFSNEATLKGHRSMYCTFVPSAGKDDGEEHKVDDQGPAAKKIALVPLLADRETPPHASLMCRSCGYKGMSRRGMKSHIRTHLPPGIGDISPFLNAFLQVTPTSPPTGKKTPLPLPPPALLCAQCMQAYANMGDYTKHDCHPRGVVLQDKNSPQPTPPDRQYNGADDGAIDVTK